MTGAGYSLSALEQELSELRRDYAAFGGAYDMLRKRLLDSSEAQPVRNPELHTWSGTRAVIGSLEMAIHAIERTIVECDELVRRVRSGQLPNTDNPARPVLSLVEEDD